MIGDLWARWFDSREFRRARDVAERNYSSALVRLTKVSAECAELRRENARLSSAADALDLTLGASEAALDDAKKRVKALERQLDELAAAKVVEHRIVDLHTEASKLPAVPNRDRENLYKLTDENETLRAYREHCLKEHR